MRHTLVRTALRATLFLALPGLAISAQSAAPRDTSRNAQRLFTPADAALAAGFAGLTVAMFPLDRFGWHTTTAIGATLVATEILKGALGRSRPWVTADTNPRDFAVGKGFTGEERSSFPSAHAAVAFAAASSLTSELQRDWPGHDWIVGPALYGGATLVGLSRMYHDKHWTSDVVLGAGVGTFIGLKTVRYAHAHPDNLFDRVLLRASVVPDGRGGGALSWKIPLAH